MYSVRTFAPAGGPRLYRCVSHQHVCMVHGQCACCMRGCDVGANRPVKIFVNRPVCTLTPYPKGSLKITQNPESNKEMPVICVLRIIQLSIVSVSFYHIIHVYTCVLSLCHLLLLMQCHCYCACYYCAVDCSI